MMMIIFSKKKKRKNCSGTAACREFYLVNLHCNQGEKKTLYLARWHWLYIPRVRALTKIMEARMKMMSDARPSHAISLLTQCCPTMAATNATAVK